MEDNIILSTLETIPTMDIEEHVGLVSGSGVASRAGVLVLIERLKSFLGGKSESTDELFENAKEQAIQEVKKVATEMGANAIVSLRFETIKVTKSFCEVHVYGSGVKAIKY